jgi:hypothetical protein
MMKTMTKAPAQLKRSADDIDLAPMLQKYQGKGSGAFRI